MPVTLALSLAVAAAEPLPAALALPLPQLFALTPRVVAALAAETPAADGAGEAATPSTATGDAASGDAELATAVPVEGAAPAVAAGLAPARRVAMYELELQGVDPNIGTVVTDSVLAEVRKLEGIAAIGMDEIKDMLSHEANKQILGCEADDACLAEIAGALGVDDLITGKLSKVGDSHVMLIRRIDQRRARVAGVFDKRLKAGSGQEFLLSVGPAVEALFPERGLREGKSRGVAKEVALRLDPPPLPKTAFFGVAGGAVVAGAVGGIFGILALGDQTTYQAMANSGGNITGSDLVARGHAAQTNATVANVSYSAAGAMALAAGIMYLFTDWEGYGDQARSD